MTDVSQKKPVQRPYHELLGKYLELNHWKAHKDPRGVAKIWRKEVNGQLREVVQPVMPELQDYDSSIDSAIERLAAINRVDPDKMRELITHSRFDTYSVRVIGDDIEEGRIPLKDGVKLFSSFKDLITAAARSSERTAAVYKGGKLSRKVREFLDGLLLDQTAVGSYIVNISQFIPINDFDNEMGFISSTRRGLSESLSKSISAAYEIATLDEGDEIDASFLTSSISKGVSANLLDAIIKMSGSDTRRSVELSIELSGFELRGQEYAKRLIFEPKHIGNLKRASGFYRKNYEVPDYLLVGFVKGQTLNPDHQTGGEVEIYTTIDSDIHIVSISLDREQYETALRVHGKPITVSCSGKLVVTPNTRRLDDVRGFKIIGQDLDLAN